jgi:citrate synthase
MRTIISALGGIDSDLQSNNPTPTAARRFALSAQLPTLVRRFIACAPASSQSTRSSLSIAGNFLYMLTGKKPHDTLTRVMDAPWCCTPSTA